MPRYLERRNPSSENEQLIEHKAARVAAFFMLAYNEMSANKGRTMIRFEEVEALLRKAYVAGFNAAACGAFVFGEVKEDMQEQDAFIQQELGEEDE